MTKRAGSLAPAATALLLAALACPIARAQTVVTEPDTSPPPPARLPEGQRIINLPSAQVPAAGTLALLFTHRFSEPLADSDFHSLFSFDSGADIGIGLSYTPLEHLEVSLYRSSHLDVYELDVKYAIFTKGAFAVAARLGGDWRTERNQQDRNGVFAQAILGVSLGSRVRVTAVPTYVSKTAFTTSVTPKPFYEDVFNVPVAISIGVARTFNVQGEFTPRIGHADSTGVGWIASVEKTVPRHRFAFVVGNQRATTVDQYVAWQPQFFGQSPHPYFIGFNIVRQWKL